MDKSFSDTLYPSLFTLVTTRTKSTNVSLPFCPSTTHDRTIKNAMEASSPEFVPRKVKIVKPSRGTALQQDSAMQKDDVVQQQQPVKGAHHGRNRRKRQTKVVTKKDNPSAEPSPSLAPASSPASASSLVPDSASAQPSPVTFTTPSGLAIQKPVREHPAAEPSPSSAEAKEFVPQSVKRRNAHRKAPVGRLRLGGVSISSDAPPHESRPTITRARAAEGRAAAESRSAAGPRKCAARRDVGASPAHAGCSAEDSSTCPICYEPIGGTELIWCCGCCNAVIHFACIRKWTDSKVNESIDPTELINVMTATAQDMFVHQRRERRVTVASLHEQGARHTWCCPLCREVYDIAPVASCYCGKRVDAGVHAAPHSCGQPCGKLRRHSTCPHRCVAPCHAGPCPPCPLLAEGDCRCPCGKTRTVCRCGQQPEPCGQVCGKLLPCGVHRCEEKCHYGACKPCGVEVRVRCRCGKEERTYKCGENHDGEFSCGQVCGMPLGCGVHFCAETCHSGPCKPCQFLTRCPCGKKAFDVPKTSCTELTDADTCGQVCGKLLPCGVHRCKEKCHYGACKPCGELVPRKCRCGSSERLVPCGEAAWLCNKVCRKMKSCGIHRCTAVCCPSCNDRDDAAGVHICTLICGKTLSCGKHKCELLCHKGKCPKCTYVSFEPYVCPCGRTTVAPPITCSTKIPECPFPCRRPSPCGHPQGYHLCHDGPCPPCSVFVPVVCLGGHRTVRVRCGTAEVSCGKKCGVLLRCGEHRCEEKCHRHEPPVVDGESCGCRCGRPLPCGHPCPRACHPRSACESGDGDAPVCTAQRTIKCSCNRLSKEEPCAKLISFEERIEALRRVKKTRAEALANSVPFAQELVDPSDGLPAKDMDAAAGAPAALAPACSASGSVDHAVPQPSAPALPSVEETVAESGAPADERRQMREDAVLDGGTDEKPETGKFEEGIDKSGGENEEATSEHRQMVTSASTERQEKTSSGTSETKELHEQIQAGGEKPSEEESAEPTEKTPRDGEDADTPKEMREGTGQQDIDEKGGTHAAEQTEEEATEVPPSKRVQRYMEEYKDLSNGELDKLISEYQSQLVLPCDTVCERIKWSLQLSEAFQYQPHFFASGALRLLTDFI